MIINLYQTQCLAFICKLHVYSTVHINEDVNRDLVNERIKDI